jgi:quinol monooxygenase YgiN
MFARILEITPKTGKREELMTTVRQEVLPIMKKQPGFLELIPFVPEVTNERVITISLWNEKHEAEKYMKEVFPKVEQIVKPFLAAPVMFKAYNVETTVCRHLAEALAVVV